MEDAMGNGNKKLWTKTEKTIFRRNLILAISFMIVVGLIIFFAIKTRTDHSDITPTLDVSELAGPEPESTVFDTNAKRKQHVNEVI